MAKKYSDIELAALIGEVREEIGGLFKSEAATLRKDGKFPPEGSSDASAPAPDASASAPAPDASAAPAPDASAAAPAPDASAAAPAPDASSGGDPIQALQQAYSQLSPEELQAHKMALDAVLMAMGGGQQDPAMGGGMPPGAAPQGMPPGAAPAPGPDAAAPLAGEGSKPVDPAAMMAMKAEAAKYDLIKKEAAEAKTRASATETELAEVKKSMEVVTKAFELLLKKPERKAITGRDMLAKNEPDQDASKLSKAEVTAKLGKVTRNPKLEKADRDLINDFYSNKVNLSAIAHLLK